METLQRRRAISIIAATISRLALLLIAAAVLVPRGHDAVALLLVGLFLHASFGAVAGCSWNSWVQDFVPEDLLGAVFGKRLLWAAAVGAILSFAGGAFVDAFPRLLTLDPSVAYAILVVAGFACGLVGIKALNDVPEPLMKPATEVHLIRMLCRPLEDPNFRRLMTFLGSWNFAVNLAAPFFTVFMLNALHMDMLLIMTMSVVSPIPNMLLSQLWGRYADRFSNKTILAICGPMFIVAIFAWTFVMFPDKHAYSMHLLVAVHLLMGIATAGVTLASGNIGLKLAPKGEATAYLAVLSLVNAIAAGAAPVLGGLSADFLSARELALVLQWFSPQNEAIVPVLIIRYWGFFFAFASLIGLFSLFCLRLVREEGEVREREVLAELLLEARRGVGNLSTVNGLLTLATSPALILRRKRGSLEDAARAYLIPDIKA